MALFGDKLDAATKQIATLTALIASTGFKLEAGVEPSADAFTAHLAAQNKTALDAAVAPVANQLASASAELAAFKAGVIGAGVKLGDFKAEESLVLEGKTVADTAVATSVKTAIETAIAAKSARQIAASGHPAALPVSNAEEEAATKSVKELREEFNAISEPKARAAFYGKHKDKLLG